MRVVLDGRKNRAHVYLTEYEDADVARTYLFAEHDVKGRFTFEFDKSGCLLGFDVAWANGAIPPELFDEAERV